MNRVESGQRSESNSNPTKSDNFRAILGIPETLARFTHELARFNDNFEDLRPFLAELDRLNDSFEGLRPFLAELKQFNELVRDWRDMAAGPLGFTVVDEKKNSTVKRRS